jgi:hypothetical protein
MAGKPREGRGFGRGFLGVFPFPAPFVPRTSCPLLVAPGHVLRATCFVPRRPEATLLPCVVPRATAVGGRPAPGLAKTRPGTRKLGTHFASLPFSGRLPCVLSPGKLGDGGRKTGGTRATGRTPPGSGPSGRLAGSDPEGSGHDRFGGVARPDGGRPGRRRSSRLGESREETIDDRRPVSRSGNTTAGRGRWTRAETSRTVFPGSRRPETVGGNPPVGRKRCTEPRTRSVSEPDPAGSGETHRVGRKAARVEGPQGSEAAGTFGCHRPKVGSSPDRSEVGESPERVEEQSETPSGPSRVRSGCASIRTRFRRHVEARGR